MYELQVDKMVTVGLVSKAHFLFMYTTQQEQYSNRELFQALN